VTKKSKKTTSVVETPPFEIPQDLQEKINALRAIATCHNLLDKGFFNHNQSQLIIQSLEFLRSLHTSVKEEALAHPESDKVEELKAFKEGN